jgi:hypothetical protein
MHAWEEALELRAETEAWWRTPDGERFSEHWARAESIGRGEEMKAPYVHLVEAAKFATATPMFVADDMMALWQHALQDFPGESIEESDLPIPAGFVLLPHPWEVHDIRGDAYQVRAFAWIQVRRGEKDAVNISVYIHRDDESESAELTRFTYGGLAPTLHFFHATTIAFGETYTAPDVWHSALGNEIDDEAVENAVRTIRGIQAFWRLSFQEIGKPYALEATRPVRKRFARRFKDRPVPLVTVIALRPYRQDGPKPHEDAEVGSVAWSHRWIVSGHWRRQWYSSLGLHRAIYIAPFEKGPDDKPLVLKDKVYGWVR